MAVESATFISQLNSVAPSGTEDAKEGDNHLRLVKAVLQSTFPNADKAQRFLRAHSAYLTVDTTLSAANINTLYGVNATSGNKNIILPPGVASMDGGEFIIVKGDGSANTVTVLGNGQEISGLASVVIATSGDGIRLVYDHGTGNWWGNYIRASAVSSFVGGDLTTFTQAIDLLTTAIAAKLSTGASKFRIFNNGTPSPGAAVIEFLRNASFVSYFGVDTDNTLRYGGGSHAPSSWKVFHEGQLPTLADVTGLVAALAAKAALSHTHAQSDITGLAAALAEKAANSTSTSSSETSYPVGQMLLAFGGVTLAPNAVTPVYRGTSPFWVINVGGIGTQLAGTWRARNGGEDVHPVLVQRTA